MATELSPIEAALRRDRVVIVAAVMAVTVIGWAYLAPAGDRLGRAAGAVLVAGGALRIITT